MEKNYKKLNLGCGREKKEGFLNVDINPECRPDAVHDLSRFPYPFQDNRFEEIIMNHVLEHLEKPLGVLEEIYRISEDNCRIILKCPHFSCNWLHPGHKSAISTYLFDYFDEHHPERHGRARFKVEKIRLYWLMNRENSLRGRSVLALGLNRAVNFFANLNIHIAERVWCYWVGGFEEVVFTVRVKK